MKARQLIENATFDPQQLKNIGKAFDDAWEQIAPAVSSRAEAVEAARLKLANVVLTCAKRGLTEPAVLKEAALKSMFAAPTTI